MTQREEVYSTEENGIQQIKGLTKDGKKDIEILEDWLNWKINTAPKRKEEIRRN